MTTRLWILDVALAVIGVCVLLIHVAHRRGAGAQFRRELPPLGPEHVAMPALAFMLVHLAAATILAPSDTAEPSIEERLFSNLLASSAGLGMCLWVAKMTFAHGLRGFLLGSENWRRSLGWAMGGWLVALPACWAAQFLSEWAIRLVDPAFQPPAHEVLQVLEDGRLPSWFPALLWFGAVAIAPAAEECFFRGILQTAVGRFLGHRFIAMIIVAVLFGLAHAAQPHAVLPLFVLALVLGYAYERTGGLLAPLLLHALFNLKTMVFFTLLDGSAETA